jgi:RNA polymerase-interacting CarD/CdnL/TRCF family regulator
MGMLFLTGMMGQKTADQYISEKYQQSKRAIPQGDIVPTNKLLNNLEKVEQELSKGVSTPTKNEVLIPLQELKAKASGGGMLTEDLVQSYHDINERLNAKKLFDELNKGERQVLRKRYDMLRDEVRNTIQDYGKGNPAFLKEWQEANQGYAAIAQSKKVSNFLDRHKGKIPSHLAATVAGELFFGYPQVAAATVGAAAGSFGLVKAGELLHRVIKSPVLRKHYLNVIQEASNENLPGVIKNLEILDKELSK